jgi:hypothetical protein
MPFLVNQVAIGLGDEADQIGVIRKLVERHIGRLADKLLLVVRPVCSASTQKLSISPREAEAESQIYELLNQPIINFQQHLQALGWLTQPIQMLETIAVLQRTRPEDLGVAQDNLPDFSSGLSVDSIDPWAVFDCLLPVAQRNLLLHGWLNVQQESRLARKQMLSEQLSIVVVDQIRSLLTIADEFYARLDFQVPAIIELAHLTEPLLYV